MKNIDMEMKYQRDEKERLKNEATYSMNKWEIWVLEYEKKILFIISEYNKIIQIILNNKNS